VRAVGSLLDAPLVFPQHTERMTILDPGDGIDLDGCTFRIVEAVIRDMPYTRWGFDERRRVLFPGNGFASLHYHEVGQCGLLAQEAPPRSTCPGRLPSSPTSPCSGLSSLRSTRISTRSRRCNGLVVELIAPTHGLPIADVAGTFPRVREGLQLGSRRAPTGFITNY
jgi:hypothetical protein